MKAKIINYRKRQINHSRWPALIGLLAIVALVGLGCARTVTEIVNYDLQMTVTVNQRGSFDATANRYFLVVSSDPNFKVPLPSPNIDTAAPEMIEPGMVPQLGSQEAYYDKYFSSWAGYVVLDRNQYFVSPAPFILGQTATRELFALADQTNPKIVFTVRLGKIFGTNVPNTIYFDLISTPWPVTGAPIPEDHLNSTNAYISKIPGSRVYVQDIIDSSLDPSLDILDCTVNIQ